MKLTFQDINREAASTGFNGETLEKVFQLMTLLDGLNSHPLLKKKLALKGGTALNLFLFNIPRLSVDIDLNYIGKADRNLMLAERPQIEKAIQDVCLRDGFTVRRMPPDHAGGKWKLAYSASTGNTGNLELDINFLLRTPLWSPTIVKGHQVGSFHSSPVYMLDSNEIAAGKFAALLARSAGRDLFDARQLLTKGKLNRNNLRMAFTVYGGINRKDWREVSVDDIKADPIEIERNLLPMLNREFIPSRSDINTWTKKLVSDCRDLMSAVLPLTSEEMEFIQRLNTQGVIAAELLTEEKQTQTTIRNHPGLKWKSENVKRQVKN